MKKASRIFWGLGLITAAVFLVLSQMHLITAEISVWSALIGILCVALLISSIADRSFGGIFFSLGLAWLTFAEMLGLPRASFWSVAGIVILLTSGFNMLFPHKSRKQGQKRIWRARLQQISEDIRGRRGWVCDLCQFLWSTGKIC